MTRRELSPAMLGSLLLHVSVACAFLISWNFARDLKAGSVVPVTIVTNAPEQRAAEAAPEVQTAQEDEPVPDAPLESSAPPEPAPKPAPAPIPAPAPTPKAAKAAPPARPEKALDLDALSASVSKMIKPARPSSAARGPARPETAAEARPAVGAGISDAALAGFVADLKRHWNPNCDVEGAREVNLKVTFPISAYGTVGPGEVSANGAEHSANPVVKAAAERAIRSVYTVASLRRIPRELYGQRISANFPGREACS